MRFCPGQMIAAALFGLLIGWLLFSPDPAERVPVEIRIGDEPVGAG